MLYRFRERSVSGLALICSYVLMAGCSTFGTSGPSTAAIKTDHGTEYLEGPISIIDLDQTTTRRIAHAENMRTFASIFSQSEFQNPLIRPGDIVDVTIWEAAPTVLYASPPMNDSDDQRTNSHTSYIPEQPVNANGEITIPFIGNLAVRNLTTTEVQEEITRQLDGLANNPQVLVRVTTNQTNTVSVVGAVKNPMRVPLTSRGERLLDALSHTGGPIGNLDKVTLRISRDTRSVSMTLDQVLKDPRQNIQLVSGDVLSVIEKPYSFVALGSLGRNGEIPFEGSGISLAQALSRVGGLLNERADISGIFIFRFEDPSAIDNTKSVKHTLDGQVPVVYRLNLNGAEAFFVAQDFLVKDGDVVYVSSAPGADFQKFLQTISNVALSTVAVGNSL